MRSKHLNRKGAKTPRKKFFNLASWRLCGYYTTVRSFIGKTTEELRTWLLDQNLMQTLAEQISLPFLPLPDNFTAPTRTPWGGTKILSVYKQGLPIRAEKQYPVVGESWEISADPAAPCQFTFALGKETILINLIQLLDLFPEEILGAKVAAKFDGQNPILVKMLDAAHNLSVQVHPSDSYAHLHPDESGKPESWYILEAAQGSGLYFGLQEGVSKDTLRHAIEQQEDVSRYLNFVEVHPGDFFVIDAGTIHAIGAGVTLIEPQKIAPKKSGVTYRLWDWNRIYDEQGNEDPQGRPRELHIEDSLHVINFDGPRGMDFLTQIQPEPRLLQQQGSSVETLCVETKNFGVSQLVVKENQELAENCATGFHGIVLYEGALEIHKQGQKLTELSQGQSVLVPATVGEYRLRSRHAKAIRVYYPKQYL